MIVIKHCRRHDVAPLPTSRCLDQQRSLLPFVTVTKRETCPSQFLLQETLSTSPPSKKATRKSHLTSPLPLLLLSSTHPQTAPSRKTGRASETRTDTAHTASLWRGREMAGRKQSLLRCRQHCHSSNNVVLLNNGDTPRFFFSSHTFFCVASLPSFHHESRHKVRVEKEEEKNDIVTRRQQTKPKRQQVVRQTGTWLRHHLSAAKGLFNGVGERKSEVGHLKYKNNPPEK